MLEPLGGIFAGRMNGPSVSHWNAAAPDSNVAARRSLQELDDLFRRIDAPSYVCLATIELDADAGYFPDPLVSYFQDESWDYTQRFYIAPILKNESDASYRTGRITFETRRGHLSRVLRQNDGYRWGAGLRVGGVQVPERVVAQAMALSPFEANDAIELHPVARAAWIASANLDGLTTWMSQDT